MHHEVLRFYFAPGCPACEEAEKHLWKVATSLMLPVLRLNGNHHAHVKSTPRYELVLNGELLKKHDGVLNKTQLERWLTK